MGKDKVESPYQHSANLAFTHRFPVRRRTDQIRLATGRLVPRRQALFRARLSKNA
jgi:hypothetical protein